MIDVLEPTRIDVPVSGGKLRTAVWGEEGPVVLAVHGITASHMEFPSLVQHLGEGIRMVAPDLRGRGGSSHLPAPFGMRAHAADLVAILDHLGVKRAVVVGHSMGGFVGTVMALHHPERVSELILVDGGIPIMKPPPDADIEAILQAILGPSLERLKMVFATRDAYRDFWRQHPSLVEEGVWGPLIEAYVDYDLIGEEPELRSSVSPDAVREDSRDALVDPDVAVAIEKIDCPTLLMRAPRGVLNEPQGLYSDEVAADYTSRLSHLTEEVVPGTNHFTIVLGAGARTVAQRIKERLER